MKFRYALPSIDPLRSFPGQRSDEHAVIFARHHWVFDFARLLQYLFALLIVPVLYVVAVSFGLSIGRIGESALVLVYCGYALVVTLATYYRWLLEYLDYIVITNERVVDVNQVGVFNIAVSETSLLEIQDVTSTIPGFLGSMFNYGNLRIQTAAEQGNFDALRIPYPMEKRSKILELAEHYRRTSQAAGMADALRADPPADQPPTTTA